MLPKTNSMKSLKRTRVDSEDKNETKEEAAKSSKSFFAQALSKVLSRPVNVSTKVSDDITSSSLTLSKPSGTLVAKKNQD
jgi:hypothetical protein